MANHTEWRVIAYYIRTGVVLGEIPTLAFSFTDEANRSGSFSVTCALHEASSFLEPGKVAIAFERDGVIQWSGVVWGAQVSRSAQTVTFTGAGWLSLFERIDLDVEGALSAQSGDGSSASGISAVMDNLVNSSVHGATAFTSLMTFDSVNDRGTGVSAPTSSINLSYNHNPVSVAQAITNMAGTEFDFRFVSERDGSGNFQVRFIPYYPLQGEVKTTVLDDSTALIDSVQISADSITTKLTGMFSANSGLKTVNTDAGVHAQGYPRYERLLALTNYDNLTEVATALTTLRPRYGGLIPACSAQLLTTGTVGIGQLVPFHVVSVSVSDGWLNLDEQFRITSSTITVDGGSESQSFALVAEVLF